MRFGKRFWRTIAGIFVVGMIGGGVCMAAGQSVLGAILIGIGVLIWLVVPTWVVGALIIGVIGAVFRKFFGSAPTPVAMPRPAAPLTPEIADAARQLDQFRLQFAARRRFRLGWAIPLGVLAGAWFCWRFLQTNPGAYLPAVLFFFLAIGIAFGLAVGSPQAAYTALFKQQLLPKLLSRHGQMHPATGPKPDFARAQLTGVLWRHDTLSVDDGFVGTYRDYPLEIYELNLWRRNASPFGDKEKHGTSRHCLAIAITLQRQVKATTAVIDRHAFDEGAVMRDETLQAVSLEDPLFSKVYAVHCTDEVGARVMLTPAVMNRMLSMSDNTAFLPPSLLATGNRLVFVLQFYGAVSLFEPPSVAQDMSQHLAAIETELTQLFGMVDIMIEMGEAVVGRRIPSRTPH